MIGKHIKKAIVLSGRMDLREALRDSLRKAGVERVDAAAAGNNALDLLEADPRALLVLDFELGWSEMNRVLSAIRASLRVDTRPIVLIAKAVTPELVGLSHEYHVSAVHTGEISKNQIKDLVTFLAKEEAVASPLRTVLQAVCEKRDQGDWQGADKILDELAKKVPDNAKIMIEQAENKIRQEQWQEALNLLEKFAEQEPINVWAMHLLGRCRMKLGLHEEAAVAFGKAKVLNPFNLDRLLALGDSLMQSHQVTKARQTFEEATALEPGNREAMTGRGQCMLLQGEVNEALAALRHLTDSRDLAAVFNSAAILAMRAGRYEQGMSLYDAAFKAITDDVATRARLHFNKGIGYRRWHRDSDAVACFEEAIRCDANYQRAKDQYVHLARKLGLSIPSGYSIEPGERSKGSQKPHADLAGLDERMDDASDGLSEEAGSGGFDIDFEEDLDDESLTLL